MMINRNFLMASIVLCALFSAQAQSTIELGKEHLELLNDVTISIDEKSENILTLNAKPGVGLAMLKNVDFKGGTIKVHIKGENNPGRSFVGIAFNIQNDSTYESVYFRPFNFNSEAKKGNSIQYISQPKNTWPYLRENFKGQYESAYTNPPLADDWFEVSFKIDAETVAVYDTKTNTELLKVKRLSEHVSDKIGLWTGNNSKGDFKKISIQQ